MAYTIDKIKQNYPLPAYNYRVEIDGKDIAFSNVSGLSLSFETHTYKESRIGGEVPGPLAMRMPAQQADVKITLKKGLVRANSLPVLYNWIKSVQINQIDKKDITISLLDEKGDPVIRWSVIDAFPTKLDAPAFDASSNDAAIETMELTADTIVMEDLSA
jgi:phage tail-like protein